MQPSSYSSSSSSSSSLLPSTLLPTSSLKLSKRSTLLIYAQGANTLLTSLGCSLLDRERQSIDAFVQQSHAGSILLNPFSQSQNEFLYLLGLEMHPTSMSTHAFHDIHPNTFLQVITPSNSFHIHASNLSIYSTLLSTSSLSSPQLLAEIVNTWPTYFQGHLSPTLSPSASQSESESETQTQSQQNEPPSLALDLVHAITVLHVPCFSHKDIIHLNQLLPLLHLNQFTQVILVSSWDMFHPWNSDQLHSIHQATSSFISLPSNHPSIFERVGLENAFKKGPPLTVLFYDKSIQTPDTIEKFNVTEIYKKGRRGIFFSNQFLDMLGLHSCTLSSSLLLSPLSASPPRDYEALIR